MLWDPSKCMYTYQKIRLLYILSMYSCQEIRLRIWYVSMYSCWEIRLIWQWEGALDFGFRTSIFSCGVKKISHCREVKKKLLRIDDEARCMIWISNPQFVAPPSPLSKTRSQEKNYWRRKAYVPILVKKKTFSWTKKCWHRETYVPILMKFVAENICQT